jgi:wobble nucleotide-excising tRNase
MTQLRSPTRVLALVLALGTGGAQAVMLQQGPAAASQPGKSFSSRDQLRGCMDDEDALKARRQALDAAQAAHDKHLDTVDSESEKLAGLQDRLDKDSNTAIDGFNAVVAEHNAHVKDLNQEGAAINAAGAAYAADVKALNRKCASLVYRVDDMDAVMKERRAAGK